VTERNLGRGPKEPSDGEERFLSEEEEALLHDEDRQLFSRDDRGLTVARVDGKCAHHADREAAAACTECGRQLCAECVYASGGGHSFCKECMDATRLIDAEPKIIGKIIETREPVRPRTAVMALLLVLALVAALVVFFMVYAILKRNMPGV
jgi:hypothetical protein